MYKFSYEETLSESGSRQRENERMALEQSIALLKSAEKAGPQSREAVDAIVFLNRLWSFFLEDLAKPENGLPDDVRAKLISIGIWINKEIERVRTGKTKDLTPMIEINQIIRDGLI